MLRGKDRSAGGPTYMSEDQKAQYLEGLRKSPFNRLSGSRPPPPSKYHNLQRVESEANLAVQEHDERPSLLKSNTLPVMPTQESLQRRTDSVTSSKNPFARRPVMKPPIITPMETDEITEEPAMQRMRSMPYIERGTRWMEKQETRSLRMALEDMDAEDGHRVHSAAQDEAAELVWKHQNPNASYANPDLQSQNVSSTTRDYRSHLRRGSYQRSHSQDAVPLVSQRSASDSSQESSHSTSMTSIKRKSMEVLRKVSPPAAIVTSHKRRTPSGKSYGGLAEAVEDDIRQAHRRSSSGSKRILSGEKKMFVRPSADIPIWEDPEENEGQTQVIVEPTKPDASTQQPAYIRKNPFARVRMQAERLERSQSEPIVQGAMHHRVEIQRNPPSQSRRPWYMSNEPLPPTPPSSEGQSPDEVAPKVTPTKDGREVRGDDIRAATSKSRKDYSPRLPRPTLVSDKASRPIVSFDRQKELVLEETKVAPLVRSETEPTKRSRGSERPSISSTPQLRPHSVDVPQIHVEQASAPPIPQIFLPDGPPIPRIVVPHDHAGSNSRNFQSAPVPPTISIEPPSINISGPETPSTRQNPAAQRPSPSSARPLPHHSATSPLPRSTPHYSPSIRQSGALCAQCALPIAGRILSAAGQRFHPECFVCHECSTNLELVAFYPEPENKASERLDRISARRAGIDVPYSEGMTEDDLFQQEAADGDETPRFYCHCDFHELFSPRCKSCKTPIEGEVIVACGAEWHVGHFFCAQCGDPFDSTTPFVEKDGYAWCVECHTNRYSSKCKKCRKPITEMVVKALGSDWHGGCFVCTECNGEFEDGRYFLRGDSHDPVCVKCEERRLKA